jgi:uncharacterized membrane protein YdjX (TVP38/TMEM64 family)
MTRLLQYKKLITVFLFLAILLAVFELSGLKNHFSLVFLQHKILENRLSGLLIFVLLFSLGNLIQIPGWLFLAAAVLSLGKGWGGIATYTAACISCGVTFLIIRIVGGDALRQLDSKIAVNLLRGLNARPITSVLLLRILFQTMPALNYCLAMSGVRFRKYMTGTLLGLPLPIALYCIFFDYLGKAIKAL